MSFNWPRLIGQSFTKTTKEIGESLRGIWPEEQVIKDRVLSLPEGSFTLRILPPIDGSKKEFSACLIESSGKTIKYPSKEAEHLSDLLLKSKLGYSGSLSAAFGLISP